MSSSDDALSAALYSELKKLARRQLASSNGSIQPTELVHELYLKLSTSPSHTDVERTHFMALSAKAMRQIVCDRARKRSAEKRGGNAERLDITLSGLEDGSRSSVIDILEVDEALDELETLDATAARVVELRVFAGLTGEEIATALSISIPTITRKWTMGKSWLASRIGFGSADQP